MENKKEYLASLSDLDVFGETAKRLKRRYRENHGVHLCFGSFEFIFEDGVFEGIDECQRNIFFENPRTLYLVPNN